MEILWQRKQLAASDVVAALSEKVPGWSPRTIRTMLNRLVRKGVLRYRADGKRYLYAPAVSRHSCVRTEARTFVDRIFGGSVAPLLAHFVEETELSDKELERLRDLLRRKGR